MVRERKRHECLLAVRIGLFPNQRIDEAPRRIDLRVLPVQVERIPVPWLRRDAIPPSLAKRKHARPRRLQNPFQMKRQPRRMARHSMIIRR